MLGWGTTSTHSATAPTIGDTRKTTMVCRYIRGVHARRTRSNGSDAGPSILHTLVPKERWSRGVRSELAGRDTDTRLRDVEWLGIYAPQELITLYFTGQ